MGQKKGVRGSDMAVAAREIPKETRTIGVCAGKRWLLRPQSKPVVYTEISVVLASHSENGGVRMRSWY